MSQRQVTSGDIVYLQFSSITLPFYTVSSDDNVGESYITYNTSGRELKGFIINDYTSWQLGLTGNPINYGDRIVLIPIYTDGSTNGPVSYCDLPYESDLGPPPLLSGNNTIDCNPVWLLTDSEGNNSTTNPVYYDSIITMVLYTSSGIDASKYLSIYVSDNKNFDYLTANIYYNTRQFKIRYVDPSDEDVVKHVNSSKPDKLLLIPYARSLIIVSTQTNSMV
jgi:hypothetical protein